MCIAIGEPCLNVYGCVFWRLGTIASTHSNNMYKEQAVPSKGSNTISGVRPKCIPGRSSVCMDTESVLIFTSIPFMNPMMQNLAHQLKEEDEKREHHMWKMVQDGIRAKMETKASLDVELKRLEQNAIMAELIRSCDDEAARKNKAASDDISRSEMRTLTEMEPSALVKLHISLRL
jgi:hypothetical protein